MISFKGLPLDKILKGIEVIAPLTGLPGSQIAGELAGVAERYIEKAKANTGMTDEQLEAHIDAALDSAESKAQEDAAKGI